MKVPFNTEQFLQVFKKYNEAVFPMQIVLMLMSITVIYLFVKHNPLSGKLISLIISFFWLWMGIVYYIIFFTAINKAACLFGEISIIQGIMYTPVVKLESMNFSQLASDAIDVTNYLRKRFDKEKMYIMAHSGRTPIALLAVKRVKLV